MSLRIFARIAVAEVPEPSRLPPGSRRNTQLQHGRGAWHVFAEVTREMVDSCISDAIGDALRIMGRMCSCLVLLWKRPMPIDDGARQLSAFSADFRLFKSQRAAAIERAVAWLARARSGRVKKPLIERKRGRMAALICGPACSVRRQRHPEITYLRRPCDDMAPGRGWQRHRNDSAGQAPIRWF